MKAHSLPLRATLGLGLLFLLSCSHSSPCQDADYCLIVEATGSVGEIDTLRFVLSGGLAGQYQAERPSGGPSTLPLTISLPLSQPPSASSFRLLATAYAQSQVVGSGQTDVTIGSDHHIPVSVPLGTPASTCTNGIVDGDETGVDCGGSCAQACAPPALSSVTPASGPTTGGITLTLSGTGFVPGASLAVQLGQVSATNVKWSSSTQVTADLPAQPGVVGPVDVTLTGGDGKTVKASGAFSYYYGTVSFGRSLLTTGTSPEGVVVADVNGDAKPDLVVANSSDDNLTIVRNQGGGSFVADNTMPTGSDFAHYVAAGSFYAGNKADLVVARENSVTLVKQQAGGTYLKLDSGQIYTPMNIADLGLQTAIAVADFDQDGKDDVVVADRSGGNIVQLRGQTNGTLTRVGKYGVGSQSYGLVVADFNKDGRPDVAGTSIFDGTVTVLLNTAGTLTNMGSYTTGGGAEGIAAGDVTGDGKIDLVVANRMAGTISVLPGLGNGSFAAKKDYPVGMGPSTVVVGDLNRDQRLDIAVSNSMDNTLTVLMSGPTGLTALPAIPAGGADPEYLVIADLNQDGSPDLAVSLYNANRLAVLLNTSQ